MTTYRLKTEQHIDLTLVTSVIHNPRQLQENYHPHEFFISTIQKLYDDNIDNVDMAFISGLDAEWTFITFEENEYNYFVVPSNLETITMLRLMANV